ncbi:MAG: hypothetical protein K8R21_05850 [Leptospira sp.]|nr:hypothetical protein [Leptospira sp.]
MIAINLFRRVMSLEILSANGLAKQFTYPPFGMELEVDFESQTIIKLKLYNPTEETIKAVEPKKLLKKKIFSKAILTGGYENDQGLIISGEIFDFKVERQDTEVILNLSISDKIGTWLNTYIMKSYRKTPAQIIIMDVLRIGNIIPGKIVLAKNFPLNFYADSLKKSIEDLCRLTGSEFYFSDGVLNMQPVDLFSKASVIHLDHTSGLIGTPEKIPMGWKIKSLYRYQFKKNTIVSVDSRNLGGQVKILKGKGKFSTVSEDSYSELEVMAPVNLKAVVPV